MGWLGALGPKDAAAAAAPPPPPPAGAGDPARSEALAEEREELSRIIAGAPDDATRVSDTQRFVGANTRHMYAGCVWGLAAYTFSGLQHIHGQSTALTLLSMWTAGTSFLVNAAMRKVLTEASLATLDGNDMTHAAGEKSAITSGGSNKDAPDPVGGLLSAKGAGAASSRAEGQASRRASENVIDNGTGRPSESQEQVRQQLRSIASAAEFDAQRRNVFQLEAVGSWIWMLASLQQFRVHKRLKWCGYSSWMGLGCAVYYTFRHMYNVLVL